MDYEDEIEEGSSDEGSEDEVVEDLEVEKGNKRNRSDGNSEEGEGEDDFSGGYGKKIKFSSEEEMKRLSKPATAEELNRLRETENLFHSNLFRLQIEEMLKEVQLKQKYRKEFQTWFEKFHACITKLENGDKQYSLTDTGWLKMLKVKLPLPNLPQFEKGSYQFAKPLRIEVIGSYALETVVGPKVLIDVIIEIPQKFYKKDDFKNATYHLKRALYLCDLISHIQKQNEIVEEANFISDGIDVLKPKIEITPFGKLAKYVTVSVSVTTEMRGMNFQKFSPNKNNVDIKWFYSGDDKSADRGNAESATPFYNSSVLSDLTLFENYKFMVNALQPYKNIRDGIILLKVWLRQRELSSGLGDFSGFFISMLVVYLLQIRKINSFMSSYQVVRTVFNYLVNSDWTTKGITLNKEIESNKVLTMAEFHEHHKVVFVDITGYCNICYGMHPSTFQYVKDEAGMALKALDDPSVNSFQVIFMTRVPFYRNFDHLFTIFNGEALQNTVEIHGSTQDKLNHCGSLYPHLITLLYDVLEKGFRGRINCLRVRQPQKSRWKAQKKCYHSMSITFGLNLNPENCFLTVEKAGESETAEFREFWGERSELRRFQDGTITEAVVWNVKTFSEKRLICKQIVNYLMKLKFGLDSKDIHYVADQFEHFITGNVEESTMKVMEACDGLSKQLRNLKNLPLDVVSVQGASPVFRFTEPYPLASGRPFLKQICRTTENGIPHKRKSRSYEKIDPDTACAPPFVNPIRLILHMGATNKWPQNLDAIQRLRTAFYLKIAQSLTNQHRLRALSFTDHIEVKKDGFIFHLKIFCPNEIGLTKQIIEDGLIKYRHNERSVALERETVFLPKLSSALHGLYEQHSSFGPACCIVKRWINSQMIDSNHISEEVVDMLVASLYLKPTPYGVPHQPQTTFLRFLHMMAATDWNIEYIVLNINNELNREDMVEIESHFTRNRASLPALFIATPYDKTNSLWTRDSPTPLILLRLVKLCGNVLEFVEKRIYHNIALTNEFETLFEASLDPYNAVIYVNKNYVTRGKAPVCLEDIDAGEDAPIPVNGFDPVDVYVKELRDAYDDVALFFYNGYGGSTIGVVWKPEVTEGRDFKIGNMGMRTFDDSKKKLILKKELIIEDFLILGKGIVKSVDYKENGNVKSRTFL